MSMPATPRRSFTSAARRKGGRPVEFDIDGEVFYARPVLPAQTVLALADAAAAESNAGRAQALVAILDDALLPESAARIAERMSGGDDPLTVDDLATVVGYLMREVYFPGNPTGGPSPSPSGSSGPGPSSTDGAPHVESTPSTSPQTGSFT